MKKLISATLLGIALSSPHYLIAEEQPIPDLQMEGGLRADRIIGFSIFPDSFPTKKKIREMEDAGKRNGADYTKIEQVAGQEFLKKAYPDRIGTYYSWTEEDGRENYFFFGKVTLAIHYKRTQE